MRIILLITSTLSVGSSKYKKNRKENYYFIFQFCNLHMKERDFKKS